MSQTILDDPPGSPVECGIDWPLMNSNSRSASMEMQMTSREGSIPVFLYTYMYEESFQVTYWEGLTAEALCIQSAQKCDIPRLSSNLFAIYDETEEIWLCPAAKIEPRQRGLIFRLRFHMSGSAANITSLEESIVAYMFAQYRHDFLHDKIEHITMEESLGLMVLDMVRYSYEKQKSIRHCLHGSHFKKFLPKSLSKDLTLLDKWKLRKKIHKSLSEFEQCDQNANNYRMMFLVSLMEENKSWGVEDFVTAKGQQFAANASAKGIKQIEPANEARHFKLLFEDILSIGMMASRAADSSNWIVLVNQRETAPKEFVMENRQTAESLIALIDGYCRLQVDFYHFMSQECAPPSLVQLVKSRCHGPIPLSCARKKIEDTGPENGIYLIRQNPENFSSYCLTARLEGRIKNYKIIVDEDGSVGLPGQQSFSDVRALAEYYRSSVNCACLEGPLSKMVPYQPKEASLHIHDPSALPEPPKQAAEPQIEWINQDNMSKRKRWKKLGGGPFTSVYRGEIKKRDKGWIQVAIKCPNGDIQHHIQQKFCQSVDIMSSWSNQSVIKFLGIGAGFSLIMEFAPFGSMDTYLQNHQATIRKSHQVAMGVQLMDALHYLESQKIVHGNICAHNVLVVNMSPRIRVKLGDPMLSRYYHSLQMARKQRLVRWTAPELLHSNVEPTLESDRWSFGMTLWQIMAMGKIPYEGKSDDEVLQLYTKSQFPPLPPNSTAEMNSLIVNCWHTNPSDRLLCSQLLRELNRIYMGFQMEDGAEAMYWDIPDDDNGPEPILEDLSEGEQSGDEGASDEELGVNLCPDVGFPFLSNGPMSPNDGNMIVNLGEGFVQEDSFSTPRHLIKFSGIEKVVEGTLHITGSLGSGNFGVVYKGIWQIGAHNALPVAIKEIKDTSNRNEMVQFEEEIGQMSRCDHKNIVKVLGVMEGGPDNPLRLVMEYVPLGALHSFLEKKKEEKIPVSLSTMLTFAQQVSQGMAYLGDNNIVHRDLAARNVLVVCDATEKTEPEVKISDFGLARAYTTEGYYMASGQPRQLPAKLYAIECFGDHGKFSSQSDVWSFGMLLWEIFAYGERPGYRHSNGASCTLEEVPRFLRDGHRLPPPADCPLSVYNMMKECWHLDKHSRPTFRTLIERLGDIREDSMFQGLC